MTKQEAIILSAYTDILLCDLGDYQAYVEKKLGRPLMNNEYADNKVKQEIKEAVTPEAKAILDNLQ